MARSFLSKCLFVGLLATLVLLAVPAAWASSRSSVGLTEAERAWIQTHPIIRLGTDESWVPYVVVGEDGVVLGLDADFIALLNKRLGTRIELVTGEWTDMVAAAKAREIDGLSTSAPLEERRSHFNFSDSYYTSYKVIFIREDADFAVHSLQDLTARKVGIEKGIAFDRKLLGDIDGIHIVETDSPLEGFYLLQQGRVDAIIGTNPLVSLSSVREIGQFKVAYVIKEQPLNLVFSIRKDWPELIAILNKGLASISEQERTAVSHKWMALMYEEKVDYQLIWSIISASLAVLLMLFIWNRQIQRKNKALLNANRLVEESEQYNRMLFETSPIGLALCRMSGALVYANPAYAALLGRSVEETLQLSYWNITPEKYAATEQDQLESLKKTGRYGPYEKEYIHKDGHLVPVRLSGQIVEKNGEKYIWSSVEDVTEYKLKETAIEKSERKYRELIDDVASIILRWDVNGDVIFLNAYGQKFFGFDAKEIVGKNVVGTIVPETEYTGRDLVNLMREIRKDPARYENNENENIKSNGDRVWIAWKNKPVFNDLGELVEIYSVGIDISDRKRYEDALHRSRVLELLATGASLDEVLTALVVSAEKREQNAVCSIMLLEEDGKHLRFRIAPNLPSSFKQDIGRIEIGPGVGSCGESAHSGERVVIADMLSHPNWQDFRALAEKEGLRSCWSEPILSSVGGVLGVFTIYFREQRTPQQSDYDFIKNSARLAGIAIERKRSEDAVREERDKAQRYLDTVEAIIVALDAGGNITLVNRKGCELLGYKEEELLGRSWFEAVMPHPEARRETEQVFREIIAGNLDAVEYFENPIVTRNGKEVLIAWHNKYLTDETGRIIGTLSAGEDITVRKQAELALRESEEKFRALSEKSLVGVYLIQDGVLRYINPRLAEILGYPDGEVPEGIALKDTAHPDDWGVVLENMRKRISGQTESIHYSVRIIRKDGGIRHADIYGTRISYQGKPAIIGTLLDITDRKQAEDSLMASESELRGILDSLQDVYYRTDSEGRIVRSSPSVERVFGYRKEEVLGEPITAYWRHPEKRQEMLLAMRTGGGAVENFEVEVVRKDGSTFWASVNAHFYHDEQGNIAGVEGAVRDVTEKKRTEEALQQSEDNLRRAQGVAHVGSWNLDMPTNTLVWSEETYRIFGMDTSAAVTYEQFLEHVHPDDMENIDKAWKAALAGAEYDVEHRILFGDDIKWVHEKASIECDENGNALRVLGTAQDITAQKRAEQQTLRLLKQNRDLTKRLFSAQEEDRRTIARELHDEFGQWLTAIQLEAQVIARLNAGKNPQIQTSSDAISASANEIHQGIRGMIRSLRPAVLDALGLEGGLREMLGQWQSHNPETRCEVSLTTDLDGLDESTDITVYRVVQEALNNIAKHAKAKYVLIRLDRERPGPDAGANLLLTIADDGVGMDLSHPTAGMGILGMRERVLATGGTFLMKSAVDQGTWIKAIFPLKH